MFVSIVVAVVCLTSSTVLAAYEKPYYDVEDAENLFENYLQEHNKVYNRREYYERLQIFKKNLRHINERNAMFPDTVFAVNHFTDLKSHEIEQYKGFRLPVGHVEKVRLLDVGPTPTDENFDWRLKHAVSHVKNQMHCGSCYIFSALGDIEGQHAIKHNQCLALSEEQALNCLQCGTCNGGQMHEVMQELAQTQKKLEKEEDYPYVDPNHQKGPCKEDNGKGVVQVTRGMILNITDEEDLRKHLVNLGPLAVALDATDFRSYSAGILEPDACNKKHINHGVVLVGYGVENGKKYWLIKNSWGKNWGENGYVRLLRGVDACGMGTSYTAHSTVA